MLPLDKSAEDPSLVCTYFNKMREPSQGIHHTDCDLNVLFALWWLLLGRILDS
jgi:hypothetical protein